jgi:hypothetical protein
VRPVIVRFVRARPFLNELEWRSEAIERQMAHGVSESIRRRYNFAQYLPERRLMHAWADYLDRLRVQLAIRV